MIRIVTFAAPTWPICSPSPYCVKMETWLRMAGLEYMAEAPKGPPKSSTKKVPYMIRDDGSLLPETEDIIAELTQKHDVLLDAELSDADRARALIIRRTVENSLYWSTFSFRWLDEAQWVLSVPEYFATVPGFIRPLMAGYLRRQVRRDLWGQGIGRLPPETALNLGLQDLDALAETLGQQPFFLGKSPHGVDASVFAVLESIRITPAKWKLKSALNKHGNLVAFCERMNARYWSDHLPEGSMDAIGVP